MGISIWADAQLQLMVQARAEHLCTESLLGGLPVDHIPDGGEVLSLTILVLKVILAEVSG